MEFERAILLDIAETYNRDLDLDETALCRDDDSSVAPIRVAALVPTMTHPPERADQPPQYASAADQDYVAWMHVGRDVAGRIAVDALDDS